VPISSLAACIIQSKAPAIAVYASNLVGTRFESQTVCLLHIPTSFIILLGNLRRMVECCLQAGTDCILGLSIRNNSVQFRLYFKLIQWR
jgi:hypothetical protein